MEKVIILTAQELGYQVVKALGKQGIGSIVIYGHEPDEIAQYSKYAVESYEISHFFDREDVLMDFLTTRSRDWEGTLRPQAFLRTTGQHPGNMIRKRRNGRHPPARLTGGHREGPDEDNRLEGDSITGARVLHRRGFAGGLAVAMKWNTVSRNALTLLCESGRFEYYRKLFGKFTAVLSRAGTAMRMWLV